MKKLLAIAICLTGLKAMASGKSALTIALEQRRQSPLPYMVAEIEKDNASPKAQPVSHVLQPHFENPKLIPIHLQSFLAAHVQHLTEDNSNEAEPELELLAATSPTISIPTPRSNRSPVQRRDVEFARALDLAVRIQKRISPTQS